MMLAIDPTVSLGPVALNVMPVLLALAVWLGVKGGQALAPIEVRPAVDQTLWRALIVGVIVARLGYVWMWRRSILLCGGWVIFSCGQDKPLPIKNKLPTGEYLSLDVAYPMGEACLGGTKVIRLPLLPPNTKIPFFE